MAYTDYTDSRGTTIHNYGYIRFIWDWFRSKGLSAEATAALMGNLYSESFCVPYIVQGNLTYPFSSSWDYTEDVNNNVISEYDFVHNGPNGGGYGLAQWTISSRKQGYYNYYRDNGFSSIGDKTLGCAYVYRELETGWSTTLQYLKGNSSMRNKTVYVLQNYENPRNQGLSVQTLRYNRALCIYEYMYGTSYSDPDDDHSGEGGGSGGGTAIPSNKKIKGITLRNPIFYMKRY